MVFDQSFLCLIYSMVAYIHNKLGMGDTEISLHRLLPD